MAGQIHASYSLKEKIKHIDRFRDENVSAKVYEGSHGVKKTTLLSWLRMEDTIRERFERSTKSGQERKVKAHGVGKLTIIIQGGSIGGGEIFS